MIEFTEIERNCVELLIKNLKWELKHKDNNVVTYQADIADINLIIKALEKSLEIR